MNRPAILNQIRAHTDQIADLCKRNQVFRLELFGSATGQRFDPTTSDLDFLVEFAVQSPQGAAARYFGLRNGLAEVLGYAIDLVDLKAIDNPYFLDAIAPTRVLIYGH